jgi:cytochrome c2
MKSRVAAPPGSLFLLLCLLTLTGFDNSPRPGQVLDEARVAGRDAASFPPADEDYFHDMDNAIALTPEEIKGRNMWLVWSGGDDRFWDGMTSSTFGGFDLLKIIAYDPTKKIDRDGRWNYLGLINEPCFDPATGPDKDRFGLLLDARRGDCPPDPFANETKYPGVKLGARGSTVPIGSYYGYPSGIVGLRLFPNPEFDEAAAKHWDATKYFTDATYYNDRNLVRPYRVGMSCGFCHIGPSPINPPAQPAHPQWANLNSTVGAQYMWVDRLFIYSAAHDNFMFQLVHTYRPGTMDTSLVSTDNINNPRAMNAIYSVKARLDQARRWGKETLAGGQLNNKQFNDLQLAGEIGEYLNQFFEKPATSWTTHVLKDASDSVGVLGALNRVYLNIGLFSEEWLLHFNAVAGGKPISPIEIAVAEKNSSYWQATEASTPLTALFFLKAARPDKLKDAPAGTKYLTTDQAVLDRGRQVFADTCARCHSSKAPKPAAGLDPGGCAGPGYLDCWNRYWAWTKTDEYKQQIRAIVNMPDFLDDNFLSTEVRVPVTLLQTNACSPLATNAIAGNIWDNFSSQSYKDLPSVGTITVSDPFTGAARPYTMPAGGRGYTRPPSLISIWSMAPFLLNNTVGPFEQDPSVDARMRVFNASIEQMLWPEKRDRDPVLGNKVPGLIWRTDARSWITIPAGFLPDILRGSGGVLHDLLPQLVDARGNVTIGPIPKGIPVNLLANLQPLPETSDPLQRLAHAEKLVRLLVRLKHDLFVMPKNATDAQLLKVFANLAQPLLDLNKCPDFVVNRGHYFGTSMAGGGDSALSDDDKRALIEFIKTF